MTAIAIFGLATITFGQTVPSYVPTTGLVGWWPFTGNANDESGNANHGAVNGASLTTDRFGAINAAYNFSTIESITGSCNSFPSGNQSRTISVWYLANNLGATGLCGQQFLGYGGNSCGQSFNMNFENTDIGGGYLGKYEVQGHCLAFRNYASYPTPANGTWYHIVLTYDGNNLRFYNNGTLVFTSGSVSPNTFVSSRIFCFGREVSTDGLSPYSSTCWPGFNGKLDDIGIWNRALTPQEITDLYNGCQLSVNSQPTNQTININTNTQFVVSSSDPIATYQWQTDLGVGFQNLNSVGQYIGTTNDTLIVLNVTMSNNNQPFRCIVSSGSCSDTSNVAVLTVNNNVGINETSQDNLFSVFPNPAQSVINVKSDSKLIGSAYTIYDNTGKVVLTGKLNSQNTTIELGNLSGGIYMFSVGENMKQTFKVIKE